MNSGVDSNGETDPHLGFIQGSEVNCGIFQILKVFQVKKCYSNKMYVVVKFKF